MDNNILNELVNGILEIMKSSLVQIVLYGSVARGTNTELCSISCLAFDYRIRSV